MRTPFRPGSVGEAQQNAMRLTSTLFLAALHALVLAVPVARAQDATPDLSTQSTSPSAVLSASASACLGGEETRALLGENKVVSSAKAVRAARAAIGSAELLRARLCRDGETLVYRIAFLRRDGRVLPVTVDAASGRVRSARK